MGNLLMDWKAVGKKESFFTIVGTWCSVAFFPTVGFHLIPPPNITLSECYLGTQTGGGSFFFTWKTKGKHGGRAFFVLEIGPRGGLWNPQAHYTQGCHLTGPCRAAYPFRKSAANREVLNLIRGGVWNNYSAPSSFLNGFLQIAQKIITATKLWGNSNLLHCGYHERESHKGKSQLGARGQPPGGSGCHEIHHPR